MFKTLTGNAIPTVSALVSTFLLLVILHTGKKVNVLLDYIEFFPPGGSFFSDLIALECMHEGEAFIVDLVQIGVLS